jgi:hypothetical protein
MRVSLRQTGGIVGLDDRFDLDEQHLTVSKSGKAPTTRRLTKAERAKLAAAVKRLLAQRGEPAPRPEFAASDSMLTEVEIDHARKQRRFEVESGQDAPNELWDLVDAMYDAADTD